MFSSIADLQTRRELEKMVVELGGAIRQSKFKKDVTHVVLPLTQPIFPLPLLPPSHPIILPLLSLSRPSLSLTNR